MVVMMMMMMMMMMNPSRLPVIFLKDVSSRDFERLLCYMYRGEVSIADLEASLVFCIRFPPVFCHSTLSICPCR